MHPLGPRRRHLFGAAAALAAGVCVPLRAQADAFPGRPVRVVVGYAAGGATDVIARLVAAGLADVLGQPVIVENRAGANSNVAAEAVAGSAPDGHTLYVYSIANTINATLYPRLGYDPVRDFVPIGLIASIPNVLVVNTALPIRTLDDYRRFASSRKEGITFASSGSGSSIHLSGEMFRMQTGLNMLHVPYRGSAPAVTDLIGGQVQSMFDNMPSALPHVQAGRLRAIAVTSPQRSPLLPDVPTIAESGLAGFDVQSWFALAAPAATPRTVVDTIHGALRHVLAADATRRRLRDMAATPGELDPQQTARLIGDEIARWRPVVLQSGATAQ